jgi:hypothetical protein
MKSRVSQHAPHLVQDGTVETLSNSIERGQVGGGGLNDDAHVLELLLECGTDELSSSVKANALRLVARREGFKLLDG